MPDWQQVGLGSTFEAAEATEELRLAVTDAVMQQAMKLQENRDRNLARRIANAMNGARNVDGGGSSSSTSSTR